MGRAPDARLIRPTIRRIGKPSPGFWAFCWGYSFWLAGVSGMLAVVPFRIEAGAARI